MIRLVLLVVLAVASSPLRAQPQRATQEVGISGYVLAPDGTPVFGGTAAIQSAGVRDSTNIERTGRFRLVANAPGVHEIIVSVPGLATHRVRVSVPPSRTLWLPVIRLLPATYFRVRFVTSAGEPITSPRVLRQSFDVSGNVISEPVNARVADQIDGDGTVTIGPLPRGVTMMALNTPPFAHTRLPDLPVTGEETLLDSGTIAVQPGAVLHIDVVDAAGAPVPRHEVLLEDALPFLPLTFPPVRTNAQGRATFDRLAQGRYRVRTKAIGQCGQSATLGRAPGFAVRQRQPANAHRRWRKCDVPSYIVARPAEGDRGIRLARFRCAGVACVGARTIGHVAVQCTAAATVHL